MSGAASKVTKLTIDSPYGKLVQKGHARLFYNVSCSSIGV